jgi:hypothetical protein
METKLRQETISKDPFNKMLTNFYTIYVLRVFYGSETVEALCGSGSDKMISKYANLDPKHCRNLIPSCTIRNEASCITFKL